MEPEPESSLSHSQEQIKIRNYKRTLGIVHKLCKTTEVQKHKTMKTCEVLASQVISYASKA